ncbi:GNAT family N-acetyltransferase [Actinospongicola halichondriae]|uniref:GNAT family N-acetyltransferase n=1 Tax=Actinospongicola halichondriae TaxID=3236844 RepID=UPI003D5599A5
MTATDAVSANGVRIRVRAWRGRDDVAECLAAPIGAIVPPDLVRDAVERATESGYTRAVTPALPPYEWRPYLDAGFDIRERLHLLGHLMLDLPERPDIRLRRVGRRDMDQVLAIDHASFEPFWRLDPAGLDEAAHATPSSRFRLVRDGSGYALFGRAGIRGYVQRLAVSPDAQGQGRGAALVIDGLHWLRRWRTTEALVNTQVTNERAVELYERLGFRKRPGGLAVLEIDLTGP